MEVIKKYIVGIVLLLIVAILWLGMFLLSDKIFSDVNPNAASYTKPLNKSFDLEVLENVNEKIDSSFPVKPSEFFNLEEEN
ncbi:MAG: hypothetical protein ACOX0X_01655 [Candidatus Dojkabacteria bacterium]